MVHQEREAMSPSAADGPSRMLGRASMDDRSALKTLVEP
jgi:hypothetical protein